MLVNRLLIGVLLGLGACSLIDVLLGLGHVR